MNKLKLAIRVTVVTMNLATCFMAGVAISGGLSVISDKIVKCLDYIIDNT